MRGRLWPGAPERVRLRRPQGQDGRGESWPRRVSYLGARRGPSGEERAVGARTPTAGRQRARESHRDHRKEKGRVVIGQGVPGRQGETGEGTAGARLEGFLGARRGPSGEEKAAGAGTPTAGRRRARESPCSIKRDKWEGGAAARPSGRHGQEKCRARRASFLGARRGPSGRHGAEGRRDPDGGSETGERES